MWVDLPKRAVLRDHFFEWFAKLMPKTGRLPMMALMIDNPDKKVEFNWSPKDVEKAVELSIKYMVNIGLTTWPYPDKDHLYQMKIKMEDLLAVGGVGEWETDQEFNWQPEDVRGFSPCRTSEVGPDGVHVIRNRTAYDLAGDYLTDIKRELCDLYEAESTMTTFTYHRENSDKADTAGENDLLLVQAYSVDERDRKPVHFNHRFGPGRMQKLTLDRSIQIPGVTEGHVKLGVGHAAWNQNHFKVRNNGEWVDASADAAMMFAFETAQKYPIPVSEHRWWSAKFIYPRSKRYNRYAEAFLKNLSHILEALAE
jgi:hypothetical protein